MKTKVFEWTIVKDPELHDRTRIAFDCRRSAIASDAVLSRPKAWREEVSFEEGIALLDEVLDWPSDDAFAATIDIHGVLQLSCTSPLRLRYPVVSARLTRLD